MGIPALLRGVTTQDIHKNQVQKILSVAQDILLTTNHHIQNILLLENHQINKILINQQQDQSTAILKTQIMVKPIHQN